MPRNPWASTEPCPQCGAMLIDDPETGMRCTVCEYEDWNEEAIEREMNEELGIEPDPDT